MLNLLKRLVHEEEGQGMVEYGLIIALVAIIMIGSFVLITGTDDGTTGLKAVFKKIGNELK